MALMGFSVILAVLLIVGYQEFGENLPKVIFMLTGVCYTSYILLFIPSVREQPLNWELNKGFYINIIILWGLIFLFYILYSTLIYLMRNHRD